MVGDARGAAGAQVVVFDLGGVLIDWNPRYLYRQLFEDEAAMELFLAEVCHSAWNEEQDRGRSFADAIEEAAALHPRAARADRGLSRALGRDAGGPDRGHGRGPRGAEGGRARAARADQLVGGEISDRARALRLPDLVREHPGVGRARPDQARPAHLRAAARAHRARGRAPASTSTTTRGTSPRPQRSASMPCISESPEQLRAELLGRGLLRGQP